MDEPEFQGLPIDHLGIAVKNLDEASLPYQLLGLPAEGADEWVEPQGVKVRSFRVQGSVLELLEPTSPSSPIAQFIEKRGAGLHHVAFRVDDLNREVARLSEEGAHFIDPEPRPGRSNTRVVFLHPKWANGVLIELVEHL